jgi:hypothetical protein
MVAAVGLLWPLFPAEGDAAEIVGRASAGVSLMEYATRARMAGVSIEMALTTKIPWQVGVEFDRFWWDINVGGPEGESQIGMGRLGSSTAIVRLEPRRGRLRLGAMAGAGPFGSKHASYEEGGCCGPGRGWVTGEYRGFVFPAGVGIGLSVAQTTSVHLELVRHSSWGWEPSEYEGRKYTEWNGTPNFWTAKLSVALRPATKPGK